MAYPLVKFGADIFTIKGDTERDRQTVCFLVYLLKPFTKNF